MVVQHCTWTAHTRANEMLAAPQLVQATAAEAQRLVQEGVAMLGGEGDAREVRVQAVSDASILSLHDQVPHTNCLYH